MRFDPKSDEELETRDVLAAGEYDFEVKDAEETVSKAGNDMTKLKLYVYNSDGGFVVVFDYLVASEKAMFKLSQFAKAVGLYANYEAGSIPADLMIGKVGRCKLGIEPATDAYPTKNKIVSYTKMEGRPPANDPAPKADKAVDLDDDIPF